MNENHRGEELCSACGFATGHAGYGEGSIGYVDGTIGPLCDKCNERLRVEVEADSDEIERLRASVNEEERQLCYLSCWVQERFGVNTNVAISDLDLPPAKTLARVIVHTVDAEIERLRAELVSIHRAVGTLVSSCIDGQNELHGIKYGGPAKRTLRGIEGTLETIARKAAEAAGEDEQ